MDTKPAGQPLADPIRYITENGAGGRSSFNKTHPPAIPVVRDLGGALLRLAYVTDRPPATLTDEADLKAYGQALQDPPPLVPTGGCPVVWYIDTPPGAASPMHRTVSLDIVVQLEGETELTMSGGEKRIVKPGDVTIQRSTLHAWRNLSTTQWSRMVTVMTECQPVAIDGQTLGTEFPDQ